jgi:hypothetical protein
MAFQEFKSIADVQQRYKIVYQEDEFVTPLALSPSPSFVQEYEFSLEHLDVLVSEASRCENIIFPILRDVYRHYTHALSLWSHKGIYFDAALSGTPDHLISLKSALGKTVMDKPLLVVVEAKKSDFEQGWGQCLAAMVAAQKLNGNPELPIYGIVTDGLLWQFGRLLQADFTLNRSSVTTSDLDRLFGCLNDLLRQTISALQLA